MSDIQIITTCWVAVIIYILMIIRNIYVGEYRSENNTAAGIIVVAHLCCIAVCMVVLNLYPIEITAYLRTFF